jgi:hypothetical protein
MRAVIGRKMPVAGMYPRLGTSIGPSAKPSSARAYPNSARAIRPTVGQ